jgi:hypothetical protein
MSGVEGEESKRILGFPQLPDGLNDKEDRLRVLGIPLDWIGPPTFDIRRASHPVLWLRWHRAVRRYGPFAPSYDEFLAARTKG